MQVVEQMAESPFNRLRRVCFVGQPRATSRALNHIDCETCRTCRANGTEMESFGARPRRLHRGRGNVFGGQKDVEDS